MELASARMNRLYVDETAGDPHAVIEDVPSFVTVA
jgi:hypothetical protein